MFKKFLVLCLMMFSTALWGQSGDIASFEKEAQENANRALELSMYYQGWDDAECFYALDDKEKKSPISRTYVKNSELLRQIEMRDFDKALYWAEIAFNLEKNNEEYIDKKIGLNIMKLYIMRGEEFAKETYDFFIKNLANYDFEKEGKVYGRDLILRFDEAPLNSLEYPELYIFFYFKGFAINQDLDFAKELLKLSENHYPNFHYSGKYYIQNLDFVNFLVENTSVSMKNLYKVYLIYLGSFNPLHKNEELAEKYFNLYEKEIIRRINENSEKLNKHFDNKDNRRALFYCKKYIYITPLYEKYLIIQNPFYNIELAKYLYKEESDYLKYYNIIIALLKNNSICDAKKCLKEALLNNKTTEAEKERLEELFNKIYNAQKRTWLVEFEEYGNLNEINFDTL